MGKPHKPRKKIINVPKFPISSILQAARIASAKYRGDPELLALVDWTVKERNKFIVALAKEPRLHNEVYKVVKDFCEDDYCATPTAKVVTFLRMRASATGVRGSLSRLVERGFLVRPRTGFYWPADVALEVMKGG